MTVSTRPQGGRRLRVLLLGAAAWLALSAPGMAAETPPAAAPQASAAEPAPAVAAEALPAEDLFTSEELRTLLAPFALYPDQLLAQLLPASAYPVDIVMAARWLDKNEAAVKAGDFAGADAQGWDPSVKALVRFPTIIETLNTDLDATSDLGDAFVNQPEDVADVIQALRREAQAAGSLKSTPQQTVTVRQQTSGSTVNDYVVIEPAEPGVIYVPTYDPAVVYYEDNSDLAAGLIGFGVGVAVGVAIDNAWDWGRGWVYPPRWPGYPGYRPGIGGINNGNINIGNEVNIGSGNTRPWRPDAGKYHPGQGSKPGLAATARPGGVNRTNLGERANAGDRVKAGDRAALGDRAEGLGAGARAGGGDLAGKKAAAGDKLSGARADGKLDGKLGDGKADGIRNAAAGKGAGGGAAADKVANAKAAGVKKPDGGAKKAVANKAANKPVGKPAMQQRPSPQRPANTAFSGASLGGGTAGAMANRGAASRQSVARPSGGGRPQMARGGGGGGGPVMRGGGGGRGGRR